MIFFPEINYKIDLYCNISYNNLRKLLPIYAIYIVFRPMWKLVNGVDLSYLFVESC